MTKQSAEQIKRLSERIEREEQAEFDALLELTAASLSGEENGPALASITDRGRIAQLTLRIFRLQSCLALPSAEQKQYAGLPSEDWDKLLDCVRHLTGAYEVTEETVHSSVELALLAAPENRAAITKLAETKFSRWQLREKHRRPITWTVYFCACRMIEYCLANGLVPQSTLLVRNLVALSQTRNAEQDCNHRQLVVQALRYLSDADDAAALEIGTAQAHCFDGTDDELAAQFCWVFGFIVNKTDSEAAIPYFRRCSEIFLAREGSRSWSAAKAALMERLCLFDLKRYEEAEPFLWRFLKNVEEGYYSKTDETVAYTSAYTRSILLGHAMENGSLRGLLPELERFAAYCREQEAEANNPRLTVRVAENYLSGYYAELGEPLTAAQHAQNALEAQLPHGLPKYPTDEILLSNLLHIYSTINDADRMDRLSEELLARLGEVEDFKESRSDYYRICVLIVSASAKLGADDEAAGRNLKKLLTDFYRTMDAHTEKWRAAGETDTGYALLLVTAMASVLEGSPPAHGELQCYLRVAEHLLAHPEVYAFRDIQKGMTYMLQANLLCRLGDPRAIPAAEECLRCAAQLDPAQEAAISMKRFVALVFNCMGRRELVKPVVEDALAGVTDAWHKAVAYLSDHRVSQVMAFIQLYGNICYAMLKQTASDAERYEQILHFKDLPALVGRERNRLLRVEPVDEALKKQIFALQDQLAAAQLQSADDDETDRAAELSEELRRLETQFAQKFPANVRFTEISLDRVEACLEEQDAIVEYYFSPAGDGLSPEQTLEQVQELEIFILTKKRGRAKLRCVRLAEGKQIVDCAEALAAHEQGRDTLEDSDAAILKQQLTDRLITPLLPELQDARRVYLAPDQILCSLPLENLFRNEDSGAFLNGRLCRIVCGRDLLFFRDGGDGAGGSFVLGDPDYDLGLHREPGVERLGADDGAACPLPFSGLEVREISRLCRCEPYTGRRATKFALQEALPSRIIHLATHGVIDEAMETDSLFTSALLFAGYNRWAKDGKEIAPYGNGVLTADEISRMDLTKTELVVLSACRSGLGDTSFGSVQGLLSAFSAAGARWVVCHIWSADDFATAVLMGRFYREYLEYGKSVPDALHAAKDYLRCVTVAQLRKDGWLRIPWELRGDRNVISRIEAIDRANDHRTPFNREYFWGGFVCYRCR